MTAMSTDTCAGHADLAAELRALALTLLDRLQPVLDRARSGDVTAVGSNQPIGSDQPTTCGVCPVCAVLSAVRGERPELLARLAEHTAGIVAVLRATLAEGIAASEQTATGEPNRPSAARPVQHIHVERRTTR